MYKIFDYNNVHLGEINLYSDPKKNYINFWGQPNGRLRGKRFYFRPDGITENPVEYIRKQTVGSLWPSDKFQKKVFISSSSSLPRDAVRNSNYKIVRDIQNAEWAIIPYPKSVETIEYNIAVYYGEDLYLFTIDWVCKKPETITEELKNTVFELIKKTLTDLEPPMMYCPNWSPLRIYALPKCDEYEMIARREEIQGEWIIDENVELRPSVNINLETLITWKSADDKEVLRKVIDQSDWKKYPVTICVFLAAEHPYIFNGANGRFKDILGQIHFNEFKDEDKMTDVTVSPEDMNMLNQWIMYRCGVSENGGFLDGSKDSDNNRAFRMYAKLIARRYVIKPIKIEHPTTFGNILAEAQNLSQVS